MNRIVTIGGLAGFILGIIPLLALTFFSPGLSAEGIRGVLAFVLGVVTLLLLVLAARQAKWLWILVAIQTLLLTGVMVETLSDSRLYIGT